MPTPAETAEREMRGLVARLDEHATRLEEWAAKVRVTDLLPQDEVTATVTVANKDTTRLAELMQGHRETTGCPAREFKVPTEVSEHVKELCDALANSNKQRNQIAAFLRSLAAALRNLEVTGKTAIQRTDRASLRDKAVAEVTQTADTKDPKWTTPAGTDGAEWLRGAFELHDEQLSKTQAELTTDGYASLSQLIEAGETSWIHEEPQADAGKPDETPTGKEATATEPVIVAIRPAPAAKAAPAATAPAEPEKTAPVKIETQKTLPVEAEKPKQPAMPSRAS